MKTKRQAGKLVIALVAFFAVVLFPINSYATHSWGGYHWARTANPFRLTVVDSNTSEWQSYFDTSNSAWSNLPDSVNFPHVLNLASIQGDESSNARKRCVMITGKIHSCNAAYGNNGWLGLASINISGGVHITQGTSKMNDSYFSTAKYNNPNERLHVMCQEVGHTFGLDHQSTNGSSQNTCMDYFSNTGTNEGSTLSTLPNAHDNEELAIIYAHLDSSTTIAFGGFAQVLGFDDDNDDPRAWGRLTSQAGNGRSSTYERENRDGTKTATHVLWTEEAAGRCRGCDHRFQ